MLSSGDIAPSVIRNRSKLVISEAQDAAGLNWSLSGAQIVITKILSVSMAEAAEYEHQKYL